jgi:1-acyl-sn-glycerol-3-phosphate acyltransferase
MADNPPTERGSALRWLRRGRDADWGRDPTLIDMQAVEATWQRVHSLRHVPWFRTEVDGLDSIPPSPVLIVMNHSGGDLFLDFWGFIYAWYARFGFSRPIRPLAHEVLLGQSMTGPYLARRGILIANRDIAHRALTELRHDVIVAPGGDREAWRPSIDEYRVDFSGRRGYAQLAHDAGVATVPVAHAGAHATLHVLARGERIARLLRLRELANANIWPVHFSLPWGIAVGPLPHIPWPARLRYSVGAAIPATGDPEALDVAVRGSIQKGLDGLKGNGT